MTAFVSSPASDDLAKSVLKIKNGKFITIQKLKNKMTLCAVEIQDEQEKGTTWNQKNILTHSALIHIPAEQQCCLLSVVAPLVHIQTKGTSYAFKFYYDQSWYCMKAVANSLQVNLPWTYWWDLLWVFVLTFLKL